MPVPFRYEFQPYIFHVDILTLSRNGNDVRLSEQSARVLAELLLHAGEVISRQQISLAVWPDGEFGSSEQGLNNIISKLRISLRDDPKQPHYIETIPKRGYRFVAPVTVLWPESKFGDLAMSKSRHEAAGDPASALATSPTPTLDKSPREWPAIPRRSAVRLLAVSGASLIIVLGLISFWLHQAHRKHPGTQPEITLAVAPFDVRGDAGSHFAESLRMDLIDGLSGLPGIRVRAAHSLVPGDRVAAGQDGRQLGVTAILYTQFSKVGSLFELHAELVRAADATHLYSWDYSGTAGQLGAIREQMLADIYSYWRGSAPAHQQEIGGTRDPQAYELYLRARYQTRLRSPAGMTAAIQDYRQAIERDPHFAQAYSGLAYATYMLLPTNSGYQQAQKFALRAIVLAPSLADAHAVLGNIYFRHDWRFASGVEQMQQAIALEPNDANYHMWLGFMLGNLGRFQEDFEQLALAQKDDPLWAPVYENEVNLGFISRRYDRMWKAVDTLNAIKSGSHAAYHTSAWANWEAGRYRQAIVDWRQADVQEGAEDKVALQDRGLAALDAGGPKAYARLRLALAMQYQKEGQSNSDYLVPEWAAYSGDKALCLTELKKMVDQRDVNSIQLAVMPAFDFLHRDPRYLALIRQVGLPLPHDAPRAGAPAAKVQAVTDQSAGRPKNSV
jgi:DNA-binding winged helix-turn-helix (wHTH) protein/TolB-like protein